MKKISLLLIGVITAFCLVGCSDKSEHDTSMTVDDTNGYETETVVDAETYDDNEVVLYY